MSAHGQPAGDRHTTIIALAQTRRKTIVCSTPWRSILSKVAPSSEVCHFLASSTLCIESNLAGSGERYGMENAL